MTWDQHNKIIIPLVKQQVQIHKLYLTKTPDHINKIATSFTSVWTEQLYDKIQKYYTDITQK